MEINYPSQFYFNSSWKKSLKCCICLEYFDHPHTLRCGHSFCLRCLSNLACITRQQHLYTHPSKLRITCPTCRRPQRALPILRRKVSINYALQGLVENWVSEKQEVRKESVITVRSTATQSDIPPHSKTLTSNTDGVQEEDIAKEQFSELPSRIDLSSVFEIDMERSNNNEGMNSHATCSWCHGFEDETDDNGAVEESDEDEWISLHIVDAFRFAAVDLQDAIYEMFHSPSRIIMALIWTAYTVSVLVIANGFLPYMCLYSLLFILILYTETLEQRRNRL